MFFIWFSVSVFSEYTHASVMNVLCSWRLVLSLCVPQAAVRSQKGEKGEPAILEPVSYSLSIGIFICAGALKLLLS